MCKMAQWRYVSPRASSLPRKVKVPQARMSMCAVMLVKDALPTAPRPSPPLKKGSFKRRGHRAHPCALSGGVADDLPCVLLSFCRGIQCGNADAMAVRGNCRGTTRFREGFHENSHCKPPQCFLAFLSFGSLSRRHC